MSTELKHTPGPWFEANKNVQDHLIKESSGFRIRIFFGQSMFAFCDVFGKDEAEAKANVTLIAAAPEMFEVIKELYDFANNHKVYGSIYPKLAAAFKKATEG